MNVHVILEGNSSLTGLFEIGAGERVSCFKEVMFSLDACEELPLGSILATSPRIYQIAKELTWNVIAIKASLRATKKMKMQVSNFWRSIFFSLLHSDHTKMILPLSLQNKGRERHINTNAVEEVRYLMYLKGSESVKEHSVRLTGNCSFRISISKILSAVNNSSWQPIQKSYNLDITK